ncbi:MAG: cupredoxin domain-containing protein [Patescibacteria group bacterium]
MENIKNETLDNGVKIKSEQLVSADKSNTIPSSTKKSLALIIVEIVLLLAVIALAIIFFTRKNNVNINVSNPVNNQAVNEVGEIVTPINEEKTPVVTNITPAKPTPVVKVKEDLRMSLPAPLQSEVTTESAIPEGAIKIIGTETGFEPKEFTVKAGEKIVLALTAKGASPVVLTFYNSNMPPVSIGCGPGETRWVTLTAPTTAGEYIFKNDMIGHSNETGKMIVK